MDTHSPVLATLCYIRRDGETLMLLRNSKKDDVHEGKWNGIGGKFEPGESPEQCARREIQEEADLEIQELNLEGILTFPEFDANDWYVFVYSTHSFTGNVNDECDEGELHWIPDENLLDLDLWEGDQYFLREVGNNSVFSGRFNYENEELQDWNIELH